MEQADAHRALLASADDMHVVMRPSLSADAARGMIDAAVRQALAMSVAVTVAAVDESGVLKAIARMDGAPLLSVRTAQDKARAAAAAGVATDEFYDAISSDGAAIAAFANRPGMALIAGGLPVLAGRLVAGAIGVAGAMAAADDRRIAEAALRILEEPGMGSSSRRR